MYIILSLPCILFIIDLSNFAFILVIVSYKCLGKQIIIVTVNDVVKRFEVILLITSQFENNFRQYYKNKRLRKSIDSTTNSYPDF